MKITRYEFIINGNKIGLFTAQQTLWSMFLDDQLLNYFHMLENQVPIPSNNFKKKYMSGKNTTISYFLPKGIKRTFKMIEKIKNHITKYNNITLTSYEIEIDNNDPNILLNDNYQIILKIA